MVPYANGGGNSNVEEYEYDATSIRVKFSDGQTYEYTFEKTGVSNVLRMQQLADSGQGLNSFINKTVKKNYARKWR